MIKNRANEYIKSILFLMLLVFSSHASAQLQTGAEQLSKYLPALNGKKVGLVVNQTSMVGHKHLLDTLLQLKVNVKMIFAPEHGFRGDHSAGAKVESGIDAKTKLPVVSLYGKNKKPAAEQMKKIDVVIFDIQDVGVRFYTYISTLHYLMEACAENGTQLIVLDRPNPNGFYVDGPVLDTSFKSFVGMHPVPVVHGMTVGEYAQMINGEGWLKNKITCKLSVIRVSYYVHETRYNLPIPPSPNLPTMEAIYLYPSICLFEGTNYSLGRGTDKPFECVGKPGCLIGTYTFTPRSIPGVAEDPPYKDRLCKGFLLSDFAKNFGSYKPKINLFWLLDMYKNDTTKEHFFIPFFDKLAGTDKLRKQIQEGLNEEEIRKTWQDELTKFMETRKKYLLYY